MIKMFWKTVFAYYPLRWIKIIGAFAALFLLNPIPSAGDCSPGPRAFYGYTFVNPNITNTEEELAPFFLNFGNIYHEFFKSQEDIYINDNVKEWAERYCGNAQEKDVRAVVYSYSQHELQRLKQAMMNEKSSLSTLGSRLSNNSFTRYMYKHKCVETVDYLIFAKKCEPHVVAPVNTWKDVKRNESAMRQLIDEAKERFLRTESHYVRLRLAFQAIRLAHYINDYDLTLELVNYYLPKIDNDPSIIEYWIMGHRAGALQAKGELAKSAYLYSRVFEKCPGKRQSAFRSFRINTDEEWNEAMLLCRNDHERASLFVLRAQSKNSKLIEEMEHIYEYDPQHPALEMLLVRELQKLEKDLLGEAFNPYRRNNKSIHHIPRAYAGQRVIALQKLVRSWIEEEQVPNIQLWQLAEGYLEVLAGDFYFAKQTFKELVPAIKDKKLKEQLAVFQLVLKIVELERITNEDERQLAQLSRRYKFYDKYPDFSKMITDRLRVLYKGQGSGAKAYLMEYSLSQLRAKPDLDIIDELIALCKKDDRTLYENKLVQKENGNTILNDLLDVKSAFLLGQGRLEAALDAMEEIPLVKWDEYGQFNPFVRRFKDCINCPLPDTVTTYNRGELIKKILELEYDARAEVEADKAASIYFDIGEAFYNMSYFGQSWRATDCFRSGSSAAIAYKNKGKENFAHIGLPLGNHENFNTSRALQFFDLARRVAQSKEIKVAAAYMAAKCERNDFYVKQERRTFDYFSMIKTDYTDTEFYQRIVAECLDFQSFMLK